MDQPLVTIGNYQATILWDLSLLKNKQYMDLEIGPRFNEVSTKIMFNRLWKTDQDVMHEK